MLNQIQYNLKRADIIAIVYLLVTHVVTILVPEINLFIFGLFLFLALPFVNYVDKFAVVCFLISTISYYYCGGPEGILSHYSILIALIVFSAVLKRKFTFLIPSWLLVLTIVVVVSYLYSPIGYTLGMFRMIYNVGIAILLYMSLKIEKDTLTDFLPKMVVFQVFMYAIILLLNGYNDGFGITVSEKVNHNTFGTSISMFCIILFVKNIFSENKIQGLFKIAWWISLGLTVVAGSRNALLAMLLTSIIFYLIRKVHKGEAITGMVKLSFFLCISLFFGSLALPEFGFDLSRYDYITLISSGGTNRTLIWQTVAPVVWEEYRWFGYGPSHYCSTQIMFPLINRIYTHTHNTVFEAFGELGVVGLIVFLKILYDVWKCVKIHLENETYGVILAVLFIEVIFVGFGESLFANISLWLLIGMIMTLNENNKLQKMLRF